MWNDTLAGLKFIKIVFIWKKMCILNLNYSVLTSLFYPELKTLIRDVEMAALDLKDNMDPENDDSGDIWSEPEFQQDGLKEFERLDSLLSQVPKKAQHGILKSCDLVLTCIDANTKFIALGTNIGTAFLYSRRNETMQRLKATVRNLLLILIFLLHLFTTFEDAIFLLNNPQKFVLKLDVTLIYKYEEFSCLNCLLESKISK